MTICAQAASTEQYVFIAHFTAKGFKKPLSISARTDSPQPVAPVLLCKRSSDTMTIQILRFLQKTGRHAAENVPADAGNHQQTTTVREVSVSAIAE